MIFKISLILLKDPNSVSPKGPTSLGMLVRQSLIVAGWNMPKRDGNSNLFCSDFSEHDTVFGARRTLCHLILL